MIKHKHSDNRLEVPEQFLWYLFECLCIAGLVLEQGDSETNPVVDWNTIVHRDMKMANVFLSLPSETHYRCYPVPKLGDFGAAITLPASSGRIPDGVGLDTRGTLGNMPIEQNFDLMYDQGRDWPITSKANVWGVANIVASLMIKSEGFAELETFSEHKEPVFNATHRYSQELRDLITGCMRFDPNDRPDLRRVLADIRTHKLEALPSAPANDLAWKLNNTIDQEILDLVCTLRR